MITLAQVQRWCNQWTGNLHICQWREVHWTIPQWKFWGIWNPQFCQWRNPQKWPLADEQICPGGSEGGEGRGIWEGGGIGGGGLTVTGTVTGTWRGGGGCRPSGKHSK